MALETVQTKPKKAKRTISLRWLMILGFGGMVALSIGGVLSMSVRANFENTFSLLNEQSLEMISNMEESIEREMNQVEFAVSGLQRLYSDGTLNLNNLAERRKALKVSLKTVQVIEKIRLTDRQGNVTGYARTPKGQLRPLRAERTGSWGKIMPNLTPENSEPRWIGAIVVDGRLTHDIVHDIVRNGEIIAQIEASVGGRSLNRLVASLATDEKKTAFVLDADNRVIANSARSSLFRNQPTYALKDFPSLAMKSFADAEKLPDFGENEGSKARFQISRGETDSTGFFFITMPMPIFSSKPYTLGAYFKAADITDELRRAGMTGLIGLAALLLTLIAAILLANRLSKPMRRIADATNKFSRLELDGFENLPKSRVRELDTQSNGINSMHTALSQFSKYVPQKLVQRILESGTEVTRPVERPVTVMFTDIANFTAGSESLDAAAITSMLNEHFDLISSKVAQSHGTVDKYLGDGVMAFWGAPDTDDEHAAHAVEAAIAIKQAFEGQCAQRRADQIPSLQLRIGIHSGRAIVGNIGGDDRTNYTVIGHTVNVANRIEQLGKDFIETRDVIVSVSHECFEAAGRPADFNPAGAHMVRGSSKPVSLYIHETQPAENVIDLRTTGS